ncbi:MAG: right-handed parallel beta-helix repeat-containing protein [Clostridia bacterium]|nr:right-handed parallel beta-helix repeat-containing protein [Clostridia bacterium]
MKIKKLLALLIVCTAGVQQCGSAALVDSVSENNGKITISGSIDNPKYGQLVTMVLLKNDKNTDDLVHIEKPLNALSNAATVKLDKEGKYTYTMPFSNSDSAIFVKSGTEEQTVSVEQYKTDGITLYVSPDGNDTNDATEDAPLATLDGARLKVREVRKNNPGIPVTVYFLPGTYRFTKTAAFTKEDSASAAAPVVYRAKTPGTVTFKGSVQLPVSGFTTVTDPSVISRLPVSSQNKVVSIDLADYGIKDSQVQFRNSYGTSIDQSVTSPSPLGFYLNGQRQNIARWPNVGYNDFKDAEGNSQIIDAGMNWSYSEDSPERPYEDVGATFKFDEVNPLRWTKADYMFVEGFLATCYDGSWRRIKNLDTQNKTITLENGVVTAPYRRWTAVNLLEEIDMPSEFYIDRSNSQKLTLYYYPSYELSNDDVIEYASLTSDLITLNNTEFLTFKDIEISQVYAHGISGNKNNHITVDGCTISYTRGNGIYLNNTIDSVVKNSTVHNTFGTGISVSAGLGRDSTAKLIPSGIKIINNHVYNTGFEIRTMGCGISASGTGARVENNVIHLSTNRAGNANGAEAVTAYNEAYNLIRDTADAGGFYAGRTWTMYGTKYEYNYLHDFGIEVYKDAENTSGIFLDDTLSGQIVENNIIINDYVSGFKNSTGSVMGSYGVNINGGRDITVRNNVFAGMDYAVRNTDRTNSDNYFDSLSRQSILVDLKNLVTNYEFSPYVLKYPQMKRNYLEIIGEGEDAGSETQVVIKDQWGNDTTKTRIKTYGKFNPKNMNIDNNVVVGLQNDDEDGVYFNGRITGEFADTNVINNRVSKDYSVFENSDAHDYRVKTSAAEEMNLGDEFKLTSDFDLSLIGMQNRDMELGADFKKLYPQNGGKSEHSRSASISWEQALFADEYHYTVAKDRQLSDVVAEGTTIYKYVQIDGLEPNTKYYWNVTAKNTSKQALNGINEWVSDGGVFGFTTSSFDLNAADIKAEASDAGVLFTAYISNSSGNDQQAEFVAARFSSDGTLKNISKVKQNITPGLEKISFAINDYAEEEDSYCIYIWDGVNTMQPLTNGRIYVRQ